MIPDTVLRALGRLEITSHGRKVSLRVSGENNQRET
jgi:hypothetical protein